eukprot:Em0004g150a
MSYTSWVAICLIVTLSFRPGQCQGNHNCCPSVMSDANCYAACNQISSVTTPQQLQSLSSACSPSYNSFWQCFNQTATPTTGPTPQNYYCCDRSPNPNCVAACKKYSLYPSLDDVIGFVIDACGDPPIDPMWQCFLDPGTPAPDVAPKLDIDWGRVQCCYDAVDNSCKDSCLLLYAGKVSSTEWHHFQLDCIQRPSESAMTTCLADVSSTCKLGCSGLSFCTNYNNRPTDLFRHCTAASDYIAKDTFYAWASSSMIIHPLVSFRVKPVTTCHPEIWKAVACFMQVQPCSPTTHAVQLCRSDCTKLLRDCNNSTMSVEEICDILAPPSTDSYCMSLDPFTSASTFTASDEALVTTPCDPNPCAAGFYCSVNHRCRPDVDPSCLTYTCNAGCQIGKSPSFTLPAGTAARVALYDGMDCYGYLNCTLSGGIVATPSSAGEPMAQICDHGVSCNLNGAVIADRGTTTVDCDFCTCHDGNTICTQRNCSSEMLSSSTCGCPAVYSPVCASDGRTLPNTCIANCLGYNNTDIVQGSCTSSVNPCSNSPCPSGTRCVPNPQVCLSLDKSVSCPQFTCVSLQNCVDTQPSNPIPICDTLGRQHSSLCSFARTQATFAYSGYCQEECYGSGQVCGIDGQTYLSRCHAESNYIAVDYDGPCTAIPGSGPNGGCRSVNCSAIAPMCDGIVPTDACCPKCGGQLTVLIHRQDLNLTLGSLGSNSMALAQVIQRLKLYIAVIQCDLYGRMLYDGTLSLLVLPVVNVTSRVMVEVCNHEALKLATFINNYKPFLSSDPYLSFLVAAEVKVAELEQPTSLLNSSPPVSESTSASVSTLLVSILLLPSLAGTR